jgi:hypothetical protein
VFGDDDEHDVVHACHSCLHIVLLDKVINAIGTYSRQIDIPWCRFTIRLSSFIVLCSKRKTCSASLLTKSFLSFCPSLFRYSTKLRALSDSQVADFGAKLATERDDDDLSRCSISTNRFSTNRFSSLGGNFNVADFRNSLPSTERMGLGDFLREAALGVDVVSEEKETLPESSETKEMTSEE